MQSLTTPRAGVINANLMAMCSMMAWAVGLPAAEPLIRILPSLSLTAGRMGLAGLALLVAWLVIEGPRALARARWGKGLVLGGATIGLGAYCLIVGQRLSDPVTVAIVSSSLPVCGIALEVLLDRRPLTLSLIVGLALSLTGGLLAMDWTGARPGLGLGALACLVSVVAFTLGSRWTVTALPDETPLGRTALTVVGAGLFATIAAAIQTGRGVEAANWSSLTPALWGMLLFYALASMAISQILWIKAVGQLGIGTASLHINAAPFYVMLILFAMGQPWNWMQALAAVFVGLGVLVAQKLIPIGRR